VDTDGELDQATVDSILTLKAPPVLDIIAMQPFGAYSAPTVGLSLTDIQYFGGKAANSSVLRQSIPASSPVSTAFSFDLWNGFLDQTLTGGNTLREEIALRLVPFTYPPDISDLYSVLDDIRDLFKDDDETSFSPTLSSAVLTTLQDPQYGFDPDSKLRFRSSTNVEDSDQFTGAGLYDSNSGCLADDLDGGGGGPSHCDPAEPDEKGVFRAIRRVFASFYNLNAYLERLRHGVDEDEVGMALLVHHSFPDEIELANGVGTYTRGPGNSKSAYLVLQPGANSVTNPEPGQVAEEVDVYISSSSGSIWPTLIQESNLVLLGETVLDFPDEYVDLTELLKTAAEHYESVSGLSVFELEYEFKKTAPGDDLVVTQVRRIPQPDDTPSVTPFLLNEPREYCLFQGESGGSVFSQHRQKSRWFFETQSVWLTPDNLADGFFDHSSMDYVEGCWTFNQQGPLPDWPGFSHSYSAGNSDESWSLSGRMQNPRSYTLGITGIPELVAPAESPILLLSDFNYPVDYTDIGCLSLEVEHAFPVPDVNWIGPILTTTDYGRLCQCPPVLATDIIVNEVVSESGITVDTSYFWPKPVDVAAGYTAPLSRFEQTTITGLTQPIVLTGEYSQTYQPGHHNFSAEYLFEPTLEPGLSPLTLEELAAQDIRVIFVETGLPSGSAVTFYSDTEWRYHCLPCWGPDGDGDGSCTGEPTFDCDDENPVIWATPGDVGNLFLPNSTLLTWYAYENGSSIPVYDTLSSDQAADFLEAVCVESNGADTQTLLTATLVSGEVQFLLVRAKNECPLGVGTLGFNSAEEEREGVVCP